MSKTKPCPECNSRDIKKISGKTLSCKTCNGTGKIQDFSTVNKDYLESRIQAHSASDNAMLTSKSDKYDLRYHHSIGNQFLSGNYNRAKKSEWQNPG